MNRVEGSHHGDWLCTTGYAEAEEGSIKEQSAIAMPIKGTPGERKWQGILKDSMKKSIQEKKEKTAFIVAGST